MIRLTPLTSSHLPAAEMLFHAGFARQREAVPLTPETLAAPGAVSARLERLLARSAGVAAWEGERLVGCLGWYIVDNFRGNGFRAAYVPEWAHAADLTHQASVYRALYREASAQWHAAGCRLHAVTLLAHPRQVVDTWFWSGFGMAVVDAVRDIRFPAVDAPAGMALRPAGVGDAPAVAEADAEHVQHYTQPPVFMPPPESESAGAVAEFVSQPDQAYWTAWEGERLAGFLKFERGGHGTADAIQSGDAVHITGAYVRPEYRGRGVAPALLSAALADYAARGFTRCTVDFEAFNPEAAAFWTRHFEPVCLSLFRVPESALRA